MAPGGATRRALVVRTTTAEEQGATQVGHAGQDDGGGPNPAPGSVQFEGTRQERSGISLRRQITAGTWNVQGMTQGKMTVVEREMERCGLAVRGMTQGKMTVVEREMERYGLAVRGMTQGKMTVVEREMERYGLAVRGMTQGKMTVVEREMEICGLAVRGMTQGKMTVVEREMARYGLAVRGMTQGKMTVVEREMARYGLAVRGIAEHWWLGQGRFSTVEGSTIMYSGQESGRRSAGVAFMVNSETSRAVLGYNPVSDRVITLRVNAPPVNITFVQVYAPTGASSEEEITAFYEQLQGVLDNVCRKDVIVIMGDWNAKIGKSVHKSDNIGPYGLGDRNERGDLLDDFCVANELVVSNTTFQQHPRRLYTWTSPGDRVRNQIDYILIGIRWRTTILVTNTRPSADCGSDHQLLVAKLKIKLRQKKIRSVPVRYDKETIPQEYMAAVTNRFASLLRVAEEEQTPNEFWEEVK